MDKKLKWEKVDMKEIWKHTQPMVHQSKKKYNRKRNGFKRVKNTNNRSGEESC
jgi:hypothetical protein